MLKLYPTTRFSVYFLLIISMLTGISACQKEISGEGFPVPPVATGWTTQVISPATHPVNLLLAAMKQPEITTTINQGTGGVCTGGNCTAIAPTDLFVKLDNSPVTGNVTVSMTPATKYADMMFNGLATLSPNGLLITGGMVKIKATQGTDVLKIKAGKSLKVLFPEPFNSQFKGYQGVETNEVVNPVTWAVNNNWVAGFDSAQGTSGMSINVDSLTWINCDRLMNLGGAMTNIYLKLPEQYGNANTACYVVFTSQKTIAGLRGDAVNKYFWQGSNYKVPEGANVKLVAISKTDNKIFYGSAQATITTNLTVTISQMDEISQSELNTRLNAL